MVLACFVAKLASKWPVPAMKPGVPLMAAWHVPPQIPAVLAVATPAAAITMIAAMKFALKRAIHAWKLARMLVILQTKPGVMTNMFIAQTPAAPAAATPVAAVANRGIRVCLP